MQQMSDRDREQQKLSIIRKMQPADGLKGINHANKKKSDLMNAYFNNADILSDENQSDAQLYNALQSQQQHNHNQRVSKHKNTKHNISLGNRPMPHNNSNSRRSDLYLNVLNSKGSVPHINNNRDLIEVQGRNNNASQLSQNQYSDYNTNRRIQLRQIQKKNNLNNASMIKENRYQKAYGINQIQHQSINANNMVLPELKSSGSQIMLKSDVNQIRKNVQTIVQTGSSKLSISENPKMMGRGISQKKLQSTDNKLTI